MLVEVGFRATLGLGVIKPKTVRLAIFPQQV